MLLKLLKLESFLEKIFSNSLCIIIFVLLLLRNRTWANELFAHEWHNELVILFSQSNQRLSSSQHLLPATQHVRMISLALIAQLMLIHRWHTSYLRTTLLSWTVQECGAETCQQGECSYTNVWPTTLMEQEIEKILLFVCMVSDFLLSCILNYESQ